MTASPLYFLFNFSVSTNYILIVWLFKIAETQRYLTALDENFLCMALIYNGKSYFQRTDRLLSEARRSIYSYYL